MNQEAYINKWLVRWAWQFPRSSQISNAVLHPNSTTGALTGSQVLWPADYTYYLRRLRLLTNALMCCMLALLLVWPGKSVSLSSQVSLPIIYSKASRGLIPPDPFWNSFRSRASQVGSLSLNSTLPPPIVHLLRLRTPLCMTTFPPGTLTKATCIVQTENGWNGCNEICLQCNPLNI